MPDLINVILLGIIEGITEFLPISSTGHLLIAEQWLQHRSDTFNIVIQAGAMLAVTLIYWRRIADMLFGWRDPANRDYAYKLLAAFGITAVLGLLVKKLGFELPDSVTPVAWALIIGGFWILVAEGIAARRPVRDEITWNVAIWVGIAQVVAGVFPGTSRSAATIFIAMLVGACSRASATEFAFLVGIPTMYAASAWSLMKDTGATDSAGEWQALLVGFVVSAIVAFVVVKWLLSYIRTHTFTLFAYYRIVLGVLLLLLPFGDT
ncbi:MAG: undecaprenyl-diphosphate phosphatase [Dokdonella sp.]